MAERTLDERRCPVNGSGDETARSSRQIFKDSGWRSSERQPYGGTPSRAIDVSSKDEDSRFRGRRNEGKIKQSLSDRVQSSKSDRKTGRWPDRPRFKFSFSEKSKRSVDKPEDQALLSTPDSVGGKEDNGRVKLHKSDSFLKKLVRSSKDNIAEGCERLVRNIQKSPSVLRKKFLFSDESREKIESKTGEKIEEKPVAPVRRQKSTRRPLKVDQVARSSKDPQASPTVRVSICPSDDGVPATNENPSTPGADHETPVNESVSRVSAVWNRCVHVDDGGSSKSVSVEDVEDLIRSENNLRLLEQRVLLRRRIEKSTQLIQALQSDQRRSWSEESLITGAGKTRRFRAGIQSSNCHLDPVVANCSPITHRRCCSRLDDSRPLEQASRRWKTWKVKRSPPPTDWQQQQQQVHRSQLTDDKERGSADKLPARRTWPTSEELPAVRRDRATSPVVKCKLANFADSRQPEAGHEEGTRERGTAERLSKHELVAGRTDKGSLVCNHQSGISIPDLFSREQSSRACIDIEANCSSTANDEPISDQVVCIPEETGYEKSTAVLNVPYETEETADPKSPVV